MADSGKVMVVIGGVIVAIGLVLWGLGRLGFYGLPGDIRYETRNVRVYFPIITCIVLSLALTAGMWLWQWLTRR
jgi:hypothetical protein